MTSCESPEAYMLPNPIFLNIDKKGLDFNNARMIAKSEAEKHYKDAMILSWFDKMESQYAPQNIECCSKGNPGWITYAKSMGGNLSIDINHEDYVFIFYGEQQVM